MFDRTKAAHLAELSKLKFNEADFERMTTELSVAINLADKVFEKTGEEVFTPTVSAENLREDKIKPSLDKEKLLSKEKSENNCFVTKRVV